MRGGRLTIQWRIRMLDDGRYKVIEIEWKSRSGSIDGWNVEDKLSSWNSTTRVESRQTGWRN